MNLEAKPLQWREILMLTDNVGGLDITSSEALDSYMRFYDWLSYEIINESPEYCFLPFGSGHLYENLLNISRSEISKMYPDPRFTGEKSVLSQCHFIGATSTNPRTIATKLYAPHRPFLHFDEQWLSLYKTCGYCGKYSTVYDVGEDFIQQALDLARGQGVQCEPSGIVGLALLLERRNHIPSDARIVVVNTGRTRYCQYGRWEYMD